MTASGGVIRRVSKKVGFFAGFSQSDARTSLVYHRSGGFGGGK